jgi:hypothetical protein
VRYIDGKQEDQMETKTEVKHTPTPWKLWNGKIYNAEKFDDLDGGDAAAYAGSVRSDLDGEFIVRAVNVHDELVAAARNVSLAYNGADMSLREAVEALEAALAKAEGVR